MVVSRCEIMKSLASSIVEKKTIVLSEVFLIRFDTRSKFIFAIIFEGLTKAKSEIPLSTILGNQSLCNHPSASFGMIDIFVISGIAHKHSYLTAKLYTFSSNFLYSSSNTNFFHENSIHLCENRLCLNVNKTNGKKNVHARIVALEEANAVNVYHII